VFPGNTYVVLSFQYEVGLRGYRLTLEYSVTKTLHLSQPMLYSEIFTAVLLYLSFHLQCIRCQVLQQFIWRHYFLIPHN